MRDKLNIWYVYAYDSEGELVFLKETQFDNSTTDNPDRATSFYEIIDARNCINWIKKGFLSLSDEMVDPDDLKIAYKDKYGNLYDNDLDNCIFINDDGDEIETNEGGYANECQINKKGERYMTLEEAIEFLDNQGYYLKENHLVENQEELDYRADIAFNEIGRELTDGKLDWKHDCSYSPRTGLLNVDYISNTGEITKLEISYNKNDSVRFINVEGQDMTPQEFIDMANSGEI